MQKFTDHDGTEYEILSMSRAHVGELYLNAHETVTIASSKTTQFRPLLKKIVQKVSTRDQAQQWAKENPDVLVEYTTRKTISRSSQLLLESDLSCYLVQTALGVFEPLTEQEI